jgi:hypothetical protein
LRKAKRSDQQYCLFARQGRSASVADAAGAISLNDVIELGTASFIRFRHYMHMASREAVFKLECERTGRGRDARARPAFNGR